MKILTVVGARPQFVKAAIVSKALLEKEGVQEVIVHTGQHYDHLMSDVFFRELGIPAPVHHLDVGSAGHGVQTGSMMAALEPIVLEEKPDALLIYGDTNSTLAGAIVAAKLHVPVIHVEAGLRSFNRNMPEEINRLLADQVSELLLAPTETAVNNLRSEGIANEKIKLVGDVMYDAALTFLDEQKADQLLAKHGISSGEFVLATIHRAENTDDPVRLKAIINGLVEVSKREPVLLPLHPRTAAAVKAQGLDDLVNDNLISIAPLGYLDMLAAEKHARLVVTDSGGVQKEAFFARVPCVIVRTETEWVELVDSGVAVLTEPENISKHVAEITFDMSEDVAATLYGGGIAVKTVVDSVIKAVGEF